MTKVFRVDDAEGDDNCPPIVAFLANQPDKWEVQKHISMSFKIGPNFEYSGTMESKTIFQVLCLARVNKGAVVITEDLQVGWNDTGDLFLVRWWDSWWSLGFEKVSANLCLSVCELGERQVIFVILGFAFSIVPVGPQNDRQPCFDTWKWIDTDGDCVENQGSPHQTSVYAGSCQQQGKRRCQQQCYSQLSQMLKTTRVQNCPEIRNVRLVLVDVTVMVVIIPLVIVVFVGILFMVVS